VGSVFFGRLSSMSLSHAGAAARLSKMSAHRSIAAAVLL